MADRALIMGERGRGKSTAGRTLDPKKTVWIRVLKKPLPFKGWKTNYKLFSKETREGNIFDISTAENVIKALKYIDRERRGIYKRNVSIEKVHKEINRITYVKNQ